MRKNVFAAIGAAAIGLLLVSGEALAQSCGDCGDNTCSPTVVGPRQGRRTALDSSADAVLWPPNHKLRRLSISATNDEGDSCDVTIEAVTQDEAIDEPGSGNTSPDATNCNNDGDSSSIDLRGERSGMGTGRYYHVMYMMDDPDSDDACMCEALVLVPHDQGRFTVSSDEGGLFPSGDDCQL